MATDISIGLGVLAARPFVDAATQSASRVGEATARVWGSALQNLPDEGEGLRQAMGELSETGRNTRHRATEGLARGAVEQALSNRIAQSMISAAVDEVLDEMVATAVPTLADRLSTELGVTRIDAAVRSSVERVLPQVLERNLPAEVLRAASAPARRTWGLVKPHDPEAPDTDDPPDQTS